MLSSASRAARRTPITAAAVLDVFAPAAYTQSQAPRRAHASTSAATSEASSSTSSFSKPSRASRRRSNESGDVAKPPSRAKHRDQPSTRAQRNGRFRPPPLASEPSAVDLLSRIRAAAPKPSANQTLPQALKTHNLNVLQLVRGTAEKTQNYQHAFHQGWKPLRRSGMVGRVEASMVAKILPIASAMARTDPDRIRVDWPKLKELILWLHGESAEVSRVIAEWAWESVALGRAGCERVLDLFQALLRDEHKMLRETVEKAPDFASRREEPFAAVGEKYDEPRMSASLFAAAVSARAVLGTKPDAPSFSSLLPTYLDPSLPKISSFLQHPGTPKHLLHYVRRRDHREYLPAARSALRQVSLAQYWYLRRDIPGLGLWRVISGFARAGEKERLTELSEALREAVDSPTVGWMSVDEWDDSSDKRWLSLALKEEFERQEQPDFTPAEQDVSPLDSSLSSRRNLSLPLPPAQLHQSIVAKLLSCFAYAQQYEPAESLWTWLSSRSPPLPPGIVCWTGLLNGYARRGDVAAVEQVFGDMKEASVEPDLWAWLDRITAHFEAKLPDEAMRLVQLMKRDPVVVRYVDRSFEGKLPEAAHNVLIGGLLSNGRRTEAEAMLEEMDKAGTSPSVYTVNGFLKHYTRGSKPDLASIARLIELVTTRGLDANVYTFTMVLMALLSAGQKDATAKTIQIMEASNVKPTVTTYGALIDYLAKTGEAQYLTAAVQLLDELEAKRLPSNAIIYTSLIQGFLRAMDKSPSLARSNPNLSSLVLPRLSASSTSPNSSSPFSPLLTQTYHPYLDAALALKARLEARNLRLNRVGYNALLSASLDLQNDAGTQLALHLFQELNKRLASSSSSSLPEEVNDGEGGTGGRPGRQVTVADTWLILLQGFTRMRDWQRAHAVVLQMEKNRFEVRNKGLAKLVRYVTRREYQYVGNTR
ncbi:hypothetical protein JCM8547_005799 [Rhodosporidiobolus lusitaniae]